MLKKIMALLAALLLSALLAAPSFAARQEFTSLSIEVPEGWVAEEEGPTVNITSPDGASIFSVTIQDNEGKNAETWAKEIAGATDGSAPEADPDFQGGYSFSYVDGAREYNALVTTEGKQMMLLVVSGESDQLLPMMGSMKDR